MWRSLRCKVRGHSFSPTSCQCHTCGLTRPHDWRNGCLCRRCDQRRDAEHTWVHCRCRICGKARDAEHDWNHCRCRVCSLTRDDHDWNHCRCRVCWVKRDDHDWDGCRCRVCSTTRDADHDLDGCTCRRCKVWQHDVPDERERPRRHDCPLCDAPCSRSGNTHVCPTHGPLTGKRQSEHRHLRPFNETNDIRALLMELDGVNAFPGVTTIDRELCRCRRCGEYAHERVSYHTGGSKQVWRRVGTPQHPGPSVHVGDELETDWFCRRCGLFGRLPELKATGKLDPWFP